MSLSARSMTQVQQTCPVCSTVHTHTISALRRGVDLGAMGLDPDRLVLPACGTCSSAETLRLDRNTWTAAQKATLAGRRRAAALWLIRKLAKDDLWTSAGLKALRATETDPPDVASDPGATLEPV